MNLKAVVCEKYGKPEVKGVEKPSPNENQVLLKIHSASLNVVDLGPVKGGVARLFYGLTKPKDPRVGTDDSGTVEAAGRSVAKVRPGDEVFGACDGGLAEYGVARQDRVVPKPSSVSFKDAASTPVAAITALQGLRKGGVRTG